MPLKRVLIVDDAMDFGRMLQASLTTLDATLKISLVPSAEEALLETGRLSPDLLVTDVRLPGMSGLDLLRKVRARYPSVHVIVVTGLKDPGMEEKFLAAGADCFFAKPLSMDEFLAACARLLGGQAAASQAIPAQPQAVSTQPAHAGTGRLRRVSAQRAAELVSALRQRLSARQVLLADTRGQVITRAGDFDAAFESDVIPRALAVLQSSKGLTGLVGGSSSTVLACKGKELELVIAPAGDLALIIGLRAGRTQLRLSLAIEEAINFQKECAGLLPQSTPKTLAQPVEASAKPTLPPVAVTAAPVEASVKPPAPPAAVPTEPVAAGGGHAHPAGDATPANLGDLEKLFQQPRPAIAADLNDFWEKALESAGDRVASPDVISYEQARKLGLHPGSGDLKMPG